MSQAIPLVEQLRNLEHLQELDLKIDSIKKDQNSLPANLQTIDDSLAKLQILIDSKKNWVGEIEKTQRQTQAALDLNQDRLTRSNTKLDGVHNSQEFQAANKEIDQLKKLNLSLGEQTKKSTTEIETAQREMAELQEKFNKLKSERDSQAAELSSKDGELKTDIAALMADRSGFASKVEPRIMAQYNKVRGARAGLGIVPAVGGRCKGCNMMVPPQLYNEIQRGTVLHSCPCCHRILFVPSEK